MDGIADGADVGSRLVRTGQQLEQLERRSTRAIRIADAMPATLAAQMLAQQLTGAWDQADARTSRPTARCTLRPIQPGGAP